MAYYPIVCRTRIDYIAAFKIEEGQDLQTDPPEFVPNEAHNHSFTENDSTYYVKCYGCGEEDIKSHLFLKGVSYDPREAFCDSCEKTLPLITVPPTSSYKGKDAVIHIIFGIRSFSFSHDEEKVYLNISYLSHTSFCNKLQAQPVMRRIVFNKISGRVTLLRAIDKNGDPFFDREPPMTNFTYGGKLISRRGGMFLPEEPLMCSSQVMKMNESIVSSGLISLLKESTELEVSYRNEALEEMVNQGKVDKDSDYLLYMDLLSSITKGFRFHSLPSNIARDAALVNLKRVRHLGYKNSNQLKSLYEKTLRMPNGRSIWRQFLKSNLAESIVFSHTHDLFSSTDNKLRYYKYLKEHSISLTHSLFGIVQAGPKHRVIRMIVNTIKFYTERYAKSHSGNGDPYQWAETRVAAKLDKEIPNLTILVDIDGMLTQLVDDHDFDVLTIDYRQSFVDFHDEVAIISRNFNHKLTLFDISDQLLSIEKQFDEGSILYQRSSHDLVDVGNEMSICVGSYAGRVNSGDCHIYVFSDNKGKSQLCIEVSSDGTIVQCKGSKNRAPKEDEVALIEKWAKDKGLGISTSDIGKDKRTEIKLCKNSFSYKMNDEDVIRTAHKIASDLNEDITRENLELAV